MSNRALAPSLLALRLSAAAFMGLWAARKILEPEAARGVFETFYFSSPTPAIVLILGAAQALIILAFALGAVKFWSYGAVALMHTVSTLSTIPKLLDPYTSPNLLFWAAAPLLAALWLLFFLRDEDRLMSLGGASST